MRCSRPGCGRETDRLSMIKLSFSLNELTLLFEKVPNNNDLF